MREKEGGRIKELLPGAVRFIALSIALLIIQHLISNTATVKSLKNTAYNLLQLRLASNADPANDIVVLDIGGIPRTARADLSKPDWPTARTPLLSLLTKAVDSGATAIGVDIDFSPEDDGNYVLPDDPDFFAAVQNLSQAKHVPIFLGVWRQAARGSENWLADAKFADLAASLPVPKENARRMPISVQAGEGALPLQTMAAALASTRAQLREQPPWSMGLIEYRLQRTLLPGLKMEEIAVDYSQLENMVNGRIGWRSIMNGADAARLKGKLVLIGDALPMAPPNSDDSFQVPGRSGEFPGVYLHGSAAFSALEAPLYEFKEGGDTQLDLIVGTVILALVIAFQIALRNHPQRHPRTARFTFLAYYSTAGAMLLFGVWFVNVTRTMWDDFPIFIAALLIHHGSETLIEKRLHKDHVHAESIERETVEHPDDSEVVSPEPAAPQPPDPSKG